MAKKRMHDEHAVEMLTQNTLTLLPLAKKRLLRLDFVQKKYHLPYSHLQVLALLESHGSLSVSEVSHRLGIAKPNITPLVDRLYAEGFVSRDHDQHDRRVVNISLQPEGREKLTAIKADIASQLREQVSVLSAADFKELCNALISMNRILELI